MRDYTKFWIGLQFGTDPNPPNLEVLQSYVVAFNQLQLSDFFASLNVDAPGYRTESYEAWIILTRFTVATLLNASLNTNFAQFLKSEMQSTPIPNTRKRIRDSGLLFFPISPRRAGFNSNDEKK